MTFPSQAYILILLVSACLTRVYGLQSPVCPKISPATGLENKFYTWKEDQQIRYQSCGPLDGEPLVLVHGLFVNSDHWRKTLKALGQAGYHVYALDLFGNGWSSKPPSQSPKAQKCNGENGRFDENNNHPHTLKNIELGSEGGQRIRIRDIELRHPCGSPYNFFTWSNLVTDFCRDVVLKEDILHKDVTLVSNSIGTITCFQAVMDNPELYKGVFVVVPNFRELHSAEVRFSTLTMPILRLVQKWLREYGQTAFDTLAKPDIVKTILKEPYVRTEAIDDTLIEVLLDPLLTEGASKVVFDTLSYSAGPLPEQQLSMFPKDKPVWICYGKDDPWTPSKRVEALKKYSVVEQVKGFHGVGHCPHDEAPELVHPMLIDFLNRLNLKAIQGDRVKTVAE